MEIKAEEGNTGPLVEESKVCFLSNYPPKECGIATFTQDLTLWMNKRFNPRLKSRIIALNDPEGIYNYGKNVLLEINREEPQSYIEIAKKVNKNPDIKLISIQHEFGLFGGEYGSYLLYFLENVEKPVVVTFHSILPVPNDKRREVVKKICDRSAAIIVMAKAGIEILSNDYGIEKTKIHLVYHGIPNVPFYPNKYFKRKLNLKGKIVLSTFGLLSEGKGVEYMIRALPNLIKKYPNLIYLIMGETHPEVRKKQGEKYRKQLVKEVERLGLKNHVKFYNKYVTLQEIINYLLASDIYICTNLERNQIVSGTLSYALGCGRASVSTPIIYAEEILSDEKGILAEFKNPESYTKAIERILSDKELKKRIEKKAYTFGRSMTWSNVASRYLNIFNRVVKLREETTKKYPPIKLNHLKDLTNKFGCIQFSEVSTPDIKSGYTIDDNARALIAVVTHHNIFKSPISINLAKIYINFLESAQEKDGNFKNNFYNDNEVLDAYSIDASGRALWALGYTIDKCKNEEIVSKAKKMFKKAYPTIKELKKREGNLRAKAFSIIGLHHYLQKETSNKNFTIMKKLANSLVKAYKETSEGNWRWFEEKLTYSNSKLPEALFLAYKTTKNKKYLEVGERTLHFLSEIVFIDDELLPIGQDGWFKKNGKRALFDQQPVDVSAMVQAYLVAYEITKNKHYHEKASLSFNWFLGRNYLKQMVYNESTGGCYDGLSKETLNLNQGAESTIAYLIARLMLEEFKIREKNKLIKTNF